MPDVRYGHFVSVRRTTVRKGGKYPIPDGATDFGLENESLTIVFLKRGDQEDNKHRKLRVSSNGFRAIIPVERGKKTVIINKIEKRKRGLYYKIEQR